MLLVHANHSSFLGDSKKKRNGNAEKGVARPDVDPLLGKKHMNAIQTCYPEIPKKRTDCRSTFTVGCILDEGGTLAVLPALNLYLILYGHKNYITICLQ